MTATMMPPRTTPSEILRRKRSRFNALQSEYRGGGWEEHQRECSNYVMPRTGRFLAEDANKARARNETIIDNAATRAARVLGAGLMAGLSSPHQPWMRLLTGDEELDRWMPARMWLSSVTTRVLRVFRRSNVYRALHQVYEELAVYGTGAMIVDRDVNDVIHCHVLTAGQYYMACGPTGKVNTLYRTFRMSVSQMVKEFGYDACSATVQRLFDDGALDETRDIIHAIEPRSDRDTRRLDSKNLPWSSVYFEAGTGTDIVDVLRESGYRIFPVVAPRWNVTPGDTYGNGPGMESLSDNIQLQDQQFRKGQAIAYKVKPPLVLPSDMKNEETNFDPGGENYSDQTGPNQGIRAAWEVDLDIGALREDIGETTKRVQASFFADLFLMLYQTQGGPQKTATEIAELHSEKLLMLGPTLERLDTELLSPLVDIAFEYMLEAGLIPEAPQEVQGRKIVPEFVSVLAQAQRAAGINSINRFMAEIGAVAQWSPDVRDNVNVDAWASDIADRVGVPPEMLNEPDQIAETRRARAEAQAAQAKLQAQQQMAAIAKDAAAAAAQAPVDPMGMFSGLGNPLAQEAA